LNVVRRCYARGGGDSGRDVRAIAVGADNATTSPGSKELTRAVAGGSMPPVPAKATSIASAGAQRLRILHSFLSGAVLWCIGQSCPGMSPGQQFCSSAAADTSLQQNVIGAAATPAIWHVSHAQISHDRRRRTNLMYTLSLPRASV
jgi:hypothetical protein